MTYITTTSENKTPGKETSGFNDSVRQTLGVLTGYTIIPRNASTLAAPSAKHSQQPLDIFCLWLSLTSFVPTLLLI